MPNVSEPKTPYAQAEWLVWPRNPANLPAAQYKKYNYKDDESFESIAKTVSKPWKTITGQWLALFNYGTSVPAEINWYLHSHNGCTNEDGKGNYVLKAADTKPFIWVPRLEYRVAQRFRSPGKQDMGHVALDDEAKKHINTLIIPPVYSITLELGDVDALFDPMDPQGGGGPLWERKGVQQRLQALGFLYAPLSHSKINAIAKKVWEHYSKVHTQGSIPLTPEEMKATLKQEVQNNLLCMVSGAMPTQSQAVHEGRLPLAGEFAAIRVPGGYGINDPQGTGEYEDATFEYSIGNNRHQVEDDLLDKNELMHKIPLVATVHRIKPDGKKEPAEGVSVYFQLVKPDEWPEDAAAAAKKKSANDRAVVAASALAANKDPSKTAALTAEKDVADQAALAANNAPPPKPSHPLRATSLRNIEMDYGKDSSPGHDPPPYIVEDAGPKRFVDDVLANNRPSPPDPDDPQADNAPFKFGGKRDHPVAGDTVSGTFQPGIFEVDKKRDGLHKKRDDKHADYGELHTAKKVEPETETVSGKQVKKHNHAVRAVTNDKGNAGVIFMPSRCGGDRYKLRAYVGPPTLGFDGEDPGGPVVTTGTMIVWRNIRLYKYIQFPVPNLAAVGPAVKGIFSAPYAGKTFDQIWTMLKFDTGIPNVDISDGGNAEAVLTKSSQSAGKNYRPVDHQYIGLVEQFRRCYCELIVEQSARAPEILTQSECEAAYAACRTALKTAYPAKKIDWDVLLLSDPTPFMFSLRHWRHYNAIINDGTYVKTPGQDDLDDSDRQALTDIVDTTGSAAIMAHLSGGGILPGFTIIQSIGGATWDLYFGSGICTSGVAYGKRSIFLHYPKSTYNTPGGFPYSVTANAAHELGHALVRAHQKPVPNNGTVLGHEPQPGEGATPVAGNHGFCIMGYFAGYGDFCGRCVLALRGWKVMKEGFPSGA